MVNRNIYVTVKIYCKLSICLSSFNVLNTTYLKEYVYLKQEWSLHLYDVV